MISLSPVTLTGISMRLACLYTTARLFINCPNETKWEISSEVRKYFLILAVCCILLGAGSIYGLYRYIEPQLPDVATLKDVRLQIPMQIYSADGELIAQYGEKRRIPVTLDQIPPEMVKAFIATETAASTSITALTRWDFRAASVALFSGHASQGASTITQQLARNFFLSPERTLMRKIKEVFLAIRIEQLLTKDEILELYLNKIYLGYRAYGVGAAAQVYFGKTVDQLTLNEMAVIAGLPKAPSTFNPLYSMDRAVARRNVVLSRMLDEGYITQQQFDQTRTEAINANYHAPEIAFSAPYLSEMVRQEMYNRYGESAYEDGYRIYTTITAKCSRPRSSGSNNVLDYDMRHGYRGPANVLWKWASRRGIQQDYRYAEGAADLWSAAACRSHQRQSSGSDGNAGGRVDRRIEYGRRSLGASLPFGYSAGTDAA
ncbi:Penicillin-binding protein 1A [Escherichia coli]|nr:Penicillin-binding protein 1A [Escherichia coli]